MNVRTAVVAVVILGWAGGLAWGQPTVGGRARADVLAEMMRGSDAAAADEAVAEARILLRTHTNRELPVNDLRRLWLRALLSAGRHEAVADLALEGLIAQAEDATRVEDLYQIRIRALLRTGKADQALLDAKSLYNVCSMRNTRLAIDLLCECLYASRKDVKLVQQFRLEQAKGAQPSAAAQPADVSKSLLATIKVDSTRYVERVKDYVAQEGTATQQEQQFKAVMGQANLMLMGDQAKSARPLFEKAYSIAAGDQMLQAAEGIARAIRAEDGAVARANAWVRETNAASAPSAGK